MLTRAAWGRRQRGQRLEWGLAGRVNAAQLVTCVQVVGVRKISAAVAGVTPTTICVLCTEGRKRVGPGTLTCACRSTHIERSICGMVFSGAGSADRSTSAEA